MVLLMEQFRVVAAALIVSVALVLAFGSPATAGSPCAVDRAHDIFATQHMSDAHDACRPDGCGSGTTDCCPGVIHCCGAAYSAVAPDEAASLHYGSRETWIVASAQFLKGLAPLVNRHPPRDLA